MNVDELKQSYDLDGVIRVRGFLAADLLAKTKEALDQYSRQRVPSLPPEDRTFEADGKTVRNLWRMEKHDPFFQSLAERPEALSLIGALVNGAPVLAGVETFNKPARVGSGVPPHQDNAYFCRAPADALTVWIAMDAATLENGPIYYLKGSHTSGVLPHRASGVAGNSMGLARMPDHDKSQVFCSTLEPGDALIHHCQTIHWSAANKTDHPRCGMLLVYRGEHTSFDPTLKTAYDAARQIPV
jgi:phytanoyl-CoA hydroxylase